MHDQTMTKVKVRKVMFKDIVPFVNVVALSLMMPKIMMLSTMMSRMMMFIKMMLRMMMLEMMFPMHNLMVFMFRNHEGDPCVSPNHLVDLLKICNANECW